MVLYPSAADLRQRQQQAAPQKTKPNNQSMSQTQSGASQETNGYLDSNQQDLLLAALNSQAKNKHNTVPPAVNNRPQRSISETATMSGQTLFHSPVDNNLNYNNGDFTPDLDYLDADGSFDFEDADLGGEMIGALPGNRDSRSNSTSDEGYGNDDGNGHDKRKSPDEASTPGGDDHDAKRQETQEGERGAKKPGRKPLTSEPTTKRKAQNRAAQRAFRERKEKHLKDLETKVSELTKTQEADKHENGLLKAQVERLQVELRDYRKRLSLNGGSGAQRSPPLSGYTGQQRSNSGPTPNNNANFQFDFPKFGALPGSQIFGNQAFSNSNGVLQRNSVTPPAVSTRSPSQPTFNGASHSQAQLNRENSTGRTLSPKTSLQNNPSNGSSAPPSQMANINPSFTAYSTNDNMHGFASTLPQMSGAGSDAFGDLFSPSILKTVSHNNSYDGGYFSSPQPLNNESQPPADGSSGGESTAGLNRVFQFNSRSSVSDSASPSASSMSQWNANGNTNSSCGTSPEPSHGSPANKEKNAESFCDKINPAKQGSTGTYTAQTGAQIQQAVNNGFSNNQNDNSMALAGDYSVPSLNSFDPVLFGDYRESQDNILGGGDFTGGFFDDALNTAPYDLGSPSTLFGILQSPQQTSASLQAPSGGANAPTPSRNLMAECDKLRETGGDDDYGLPKESQQKKTDGSGKLISCNNIWNQLQSNPDFQDGKFDLDGLCSELRAKARCSESGVMVDQDHVNAALKKLGKKDAQGKPFDAPPLMFEQESWDNVLKKMQQYH